MKASIRGKLEDLISRHEEIAAMLGEVEVINDNNRFRQLSVEYAQLEPVVSGFRDYCREEQALASARSLIEDEDDELGAMAAAEAAEHARHLGEIELRLQRLLVPRDPLDDSNVFLEVRAGTGGDEAAIFAGDLFRMYSRYAETRGWRVEVVHKNEGEHGGFKEVVARLVGQGVYSRLKFESGAHRVQRVPETESQGRIHTSAATVAILPEVDAIAEIEVNPADLRVDTYRASGAGGQHINKTDSAVRMTHLPTGIVVECQDERSQHKNRARAMSLLKAKLLAAERDKQQSAQTESRRLQVGSGDRSERIRTYNFPQGRVTDHRINLTLYKLDEILLGGLDSLIDPLLQEYQTDQLAALGI